MGFYGFLLILVGSGPYGLLWVSMVPYVSLCVYIGPDGLLLVFMGS